MLTQRMRNDFIAGYVAAMQAEDVDEAVLAADAEAFLDQLPEDGFGRTALDLTFDYCPGDYRARDAGGDLARTRRGETPGFGDRRAGPACEDLHDLALAFTPRSSRPDPGDNAAPAP